MRMIGVVCDVIDWRMEGVIRGLVLLVAHRRVLDVIGTGEVARMEVKISCEGGVHAVEGGSGSVRSGYGI